MAEKTKILLADDHKIIRDGVKALLQGEEVEVVAEADNGREVIDILEEQSIDMVLMDIKMPHMDGIETTEYLTEHFPQVKVLALSMYDDESFIIKMLDAGAAGYVLKNTGKAELQSAIRALSQGENYFSEEVSSKLLNQFVKKKMAAGTGSSGKTDVDTDVLTKREKEILKLIAEENTNQEIAEELYISPRTVDTHRRNLLQKLNVKNTAGLVRYAMRHGLAD